MEDFPFPNKGRTLLRLLTFLTVFAACAPSLAQDEASIAAVVNEDSISTVDLAHRTNLVMFATGMPRTPQAARDLRPRVLKMMIDEALQLQAAKAAGLVAKKRGIDEVLANMERENKLAPGGLGGFLASKG
ncbi:MAG: SurA N-terminal domain-containing protein, partial [Alphaproteobacteria bacterium]|nr:SurA N-terminal domain-containing protein [Alphaproteobacteria bacterium]